MSNLNFITICWWLFIIVWGIFAFSVKPAKQRQDLGGRLFTLAFLIVMFMFLDEKIPWPSINTRLWPFNQAVWLTGCVLTGAGLLTAVWARVTLGTNWSATVTLREDHQIVERGPYRFVRHPIYTGILLMIAGTAVVVGSLGGIIATAICFFGHWWKLRVEEALLLKHMPDTYQAYRRRTKALIPFVF
jgi:protein-S-isoprenylcysteine O-methyltransferase Ste14